MTPQNPSRRDLLRWSACSALGMSGLAPHVSLPLLAQEPKGAGQSPRRDLPPLNRFSRMVQEYFIVQVKKAEETALQTKASLKTKEDAEAYVASVREKIRQSFGPNPERTPLNAKITGTV
ncbi:MAG: hypothetical protein IAF94_10950, partial [Pirellulaceae bacterium]|nr:hypothetical protein [Pirellulaceae bacterium]